MELDHFINNWLKAWTGNSPGLLLDYYADDAFYADPARPSGTRNREELEIYFKKLLSKNPGWVWEPVEIIPTTKGCTLKWKATIPVHQKTVELFGLDILEISGDKIIRNEVYFDRVPWLEAMK